MVCRAKAGEGGGVGVSHILYFSRDHNRHGEHVLLSHCVFL
jgi:hypothetical protein